MEYGSSLSPMRFNAVQSQRLKPQSYRLLPMAIGMAYVVTTFGLFLIWPVNWPIYRASNWVLLIGYVSVCFTIIAAFYNIGSKQTVQQAGSFIWRPILIWGAILSIILLFPVSYVYTDRWPWEVFEALSDQKEAYNTLQKQLLETEGQRGLIAALRALAAPLTFAVLPLGIINWRNSSWFLRSLTLSTVLAAIILSILRGTDREIADIFIISSSAFLIVIARSRKDSVRGISTIKRSWKTVLILVVFLAAASSLFTERKSERMGGLDKLSTACAGDSNVCADIDAPLIKWMPFSTRYTISAFILTTTAGYYGLSLAMEKEFQSTYGIGHSGASLALYELITNDRQLVTKTYTYRNAFDGWSEQNYWSTLITWIANDIGFIGAAIVLGVIGLFWGKAWTAATYGANDPAAVIFCIFMIIIFYLPANNQFFGLYDGYFILAVWTIIWKYDLGSNKKTIK